MDARDVNFPLLDKLRRAADRQMSLVVSLGGEVVAAQQSLSVAYTSEAEARRLAEQWPNRPREPGETVEDHADRLNLEAHARIDAGRALTQAEKLAGRSAIGEVRRHAAAAERAGADAGVAGEIAFRARARPNPEGIWAALDAATRIREKAELYLAGVEADRSAAGKRAGLLKRSIAEAETWMRANGVAVLEAA